MKKILTLGGFLLFVWGMYRLFNVLTDGFLLCHITPHYKPQTRWEVKAPVNMEYLKEITNQPFTYLDKGHQSYVFESADKKWVIKFPKLQRYRMLPWTRSLPMPHRAKKKRILKQMDRDEDLAWIFDSWKLAYEQLPEESGVLFVHINPDRTLPLQMTIIDKAGISRSLNLSQYPFLIQKKATSLESYLDAAYASHDEVKAQEGIKKLLHLYTQSFQKGIVEKDPHIARNTGIIDGNFIHLDPARFVKDVTIQDKSLWGMEMKEKTTKFRSWISAKYPKLLKTLDDELEAYVP